MELSSIDVGNLEPGSNINLEYDEENLVEELSVAVKVVKESISPMKNLKIENKEEEKERFNQKRNLNEEYRPKFNFKSTQRESEKVIEVLSKLSKISGNISQEDVDRYGSETLDCRDFREFFRSLFEELKLYERLHANYEEEKRWKELSKKIWNSPSKKTRDKSLRMLRKISKKEVEKKLTAEGVKRKFEQEFRRLDMDYKVEIKEVDGCFNIPEQKKLVVAAGSGNERRYSEKEARTLTAHETFHSIRAYNGQKAGRNSGFPELLGIQTPYYDLTEEGGAVFRERVCGTIYKTKRFDYHLRNVISYELSKTQDFSSSFDELADKMISLGGKPDRVFYLMARNREMNRHHIYQTGSYKWEKEDDLDSLLVGKLNRKWCKKFYTEAESGGLVEKPEVSADKVFSKSAFK